MIIWYLFENYLMIIFQYLLIICFWLFELTELFWLFDLPITYLIIICIILDYLSIIWP